MMEIAIRFRKALLADLPFLLQLRLETMEEHLKNEGIHLSREEHEERILDKIKNAKIVLNKNQEIGFLKVIENQEGCEIEQFQIARAYQGKGIGKRILLQLIQQANQDKTLISLSVLKKNKAQLLYEKVGFVKVGADENSFFMEKKWEAGN